MPISSPLDERVKPSTGFETRNYFGANGLRLSVCGGETFQTTVRNALRQLNYVPDSEFADRDAERIDPGFCGAAATAEEVRDVLLIDGSLDDAIDLCRAAPAGAAKVFVAGPTGFDQRRRCAEAGVDAVVATPLDLRELAEWLEYFRDREAPEPARVLVVDDDRLAAEMVAALLWVCGIETEIVTDPTTVFEALDRIAFDLVLMDLSMPQIGGIELARMIRQSRRHLSVPIVFLSGEDDAETQMAARRFGGDDFISKRTDRNLLVRLVELRVERARVLRSLIERDGLTGLIDHSRFLERVGQELERGRRTGSNCTLAMVDIDNFKTVNDTWGHQAGDHVLRRLSSALTAWLRRTDVVGRYGGEEFGVLMLDTTPDQAVPVLDSFRQHFSRLDMVARDGAFRVTFSAGIAGSTRASETASLVAAADAALYRAKAEGRDRLVVAPASAGPVPQHTRSSPTEWKDGHRRTDGHAARSPSGRIRRTGPKEVSDADGHERHQV